VPTDSNYFGDNIEKSPIDCNLIAATNSLLAETLSYSISAGEKEIENVICKVATETNSLLKAASLFKSRNHSSRNEGSEFGMPCSGLFDSSVMLLGKVLQRKRSKNLCKRIIDCKYWSELIGGIYDGGEGVAILSPIGVCGE
tara:strand:- start:335 stop:760 length:426 start_codon:yes stop_codon:yes gene_type:complete